MLPAAVAMVVMAAAETKTTSAEAEAYARAAVPIPSIVGLRVIRLRIVHPPRSVITIAPKMAMVTMAIVAMAPMSTDVGRLARSDPCALRPSRVIGVCCSATQQRGYTDGNCKSYFSHFHYSLEKRTVG